ncbi:hypothetical protein ACMZOO_09940 [Catenovulum sp. SX2]|uniref:hypothetical protein n=1 Tax=Catenovulum sp. SX2 TaxID=3398614 RepID=UPI003F85EDA1
MYPKFKFGLITLLVCSLASCATYKKAANNTEEKYLKAENYIDENSQKIKDSKNNLLAGLKENSVVRFFSSDGDVIRNREKNFVQWSEKSRYKGKQIYQSYINKHKLKTTVEHLSNPDKMSILTEFFYDELKRQHLAKFQKSNPTPRFDEFLTDAENIDAIHQYKMKLLATEHEWNVNLAKTKKEVARLMLSTLYGKPQLSFLSYDPDDHEMFFKVSSKAIGFEEKIRISDLDKKTGKTIKNQLARVAPQVYFDFRDDSLELVGIHIKVGKKVYLTDVVDQTFVRNSKIKFTTHPLNLKEVDVNYTEVLKNLIPPTWYLNTEYGEQTAFGQGTSIEDAKMNAMINASYDSVKIQGYSVSEQYKQGSIATSSFQSKHTQNVTQREIIQPVIRQQEKKDGIWFVAITYQLTQ